MRTEPDEIRVEFWRQELSAYCGLRKWEKRNTRPSGLREALAFERAVRLEQEERWCREIERLTEIEHKAQELLDIWKGSEESRENARVALRNACYPNYKETKS